MKEYTVNCEPGPRNWSAYVPDLPGCIATAKTRRSLQRQIREVIEFHIETLRLNGERVRTPHRSDRTTRSASKLQIG